MIVWAARVYGWPPDVTLRQSVRNMEVLRDAHHEYLQAIEWMR